MIDYEIQRCTRHCAASGRELVEGETFYSVLLFPRRVSGATGLCRRRLERPAA